MFQILSSFLKAITDESIRSFLSVVRLSSQSGSGCVWGSCGYRPPFGSHVLCSFLNKWQMRRLSAGYCRVPSVFCYQWCNWTCSTPSSPLICSCVVITVIPLLNCSSKPSNATLKSSCNPQTVPLKLKKSKGTINSVQKSASKIPKWTFVLWKQPPLCELCSFHFVPLYTKSWFHSADFKYSFGVELLWNLSVFNVYLVQVGGD